MKTYFVTILLVFFGCIAYSQNKSNSDVECKCNKYLDPTVKIWNHSGNDYIIGKWGKRKDIYSKSKGWNSTDFPYPRIFDLKLSVVNNAIMYGNPSIKIGENLLSVTLKLRVGQNADAIYPVNSRIAEDINVIKDRSINDGSFKINKQNIDHIDIWAKNIPFNDLYLKYKKQGLFIEQLIFEISFINKTGSCCNYEYVFPMAEEDEP